MEDVIVDVRGLKCPLPVLKLARRMIPFPVGARVVVLATDPLAAIDIPHFCGEKGHRLLATEREGDVLRFEIQKGEAMPRS